jgi:hypothetical protein
MFERLPPGWVGLEGPPPALLLKTGLPRLAFIGVRSNPSWRQWYRTFGIHSEDLAEAVQVADEADNEPQATDAQINVVSTEIAKLLVQYRTQLKLILFGRETYVRIPSTLSLARDQWRVLCRHLFTGKPLGCIQDTVPCESASPYRMSSEGAIELPGSCLSEVRALFGIGQDKPSGYDGSNLLFDSILVQDATRLSRLFPHAEFLNGRQVSVVDTLNRREPPPQARASVDELEARLKRLQGSSHRPQPFPLRQAAAAGVIPRQGDLIVDPKLEHIYLHADQVQIKKLKAPLQFRPLSRDELPGLICPQSLVEAHLATAAKAARIYNLPADLTKYKVRTFDLGAHEKLELAGAYYMKTDLASLPRRNLRCERAQKNARRERLVSQYGTNLPVDFEQHSDEDLKSYFEIQDLVARGEIVPASEHPALPNNYWNNQFFNWIQKAKPELVLSCPVTRNGFIRAQCSIEDLADLPDFWLTITTTFGAGPWLRKLLLSPKARAAALAYGL